MGNVNAAAEEDSQDLQESQVPSKGNTRDMTVEQLARYNGQNDRPSYIALNGEIFDVSQEKDPDICLAPFTESIGTNKEVDDATMCAFRERYKYLGSVVESRIISQVELAAANGENDSKIYISAKGLVFDMSEKGRDFYGPGGGYHLFAGKNAQRALALMSLKHEDVDNTEISDLKESDIKILDDWISKYFDKYTMIGHLEKASFI